MPHEIVLLNPNRYPEAAARRLRPWLEALVAELAPLPPRPGRAASPPGGVPAPPGGAAGAAGAPAGERSFGVRFVGDRAMRRANREYRGKDRTTDVLSFPGGADQGGHLGDVLVSVPQARRQAAAAGRDVERELRVLVLHGVLHCLGYDHETDGGEMERLERRLRRRWIGGGPGADGRGRHRA